MRVSKKWFAILMSALLLLGQVTGALAADFRTVADAVAEGREASYKAQVTWNSPLLVDEETNALLVKLFDAISLEGRYAKTGEHSGYFANSLKISGQDAITYDVVNDGDVAYISSSMVGSPIALSMDEVEQFVANLGAYVDAMMEAQGTDASELPGESFQQFYAQMAANMANVEAQEGTDYQKLEEMTPEEIDEYVVNAFEAYGLGEAMRAALNWTEENMIPEEVAGPIESVLEIETANAIVYELDKAQIVELFEIIIPQIMESEVYWEHVIAFYNSQKAPTDPEMTMEELQESLPEAQAEILEMIQEIPDDMEFRVRGGYDADGEVAVYQVEFLVPGQEEGAGEVIAYAEWAADGMPLYAEFYIDGEGGVLTIQPKEETDDGKEDKGFTAAFDVISAGEIAGQVIVQTTSITTEQENRRFWDGELLVLIVDETMEMGVQFVANSMENMTDEDASLWGMLKANVLMMGETVPLVTVSVSAQTAEPQGSSIDVEAQQASFVHPGQMTEEEFTTYVNEDVMIGMMQSVMTVVSLLPQEVLAVVMGDMNAVPVESVEAIPAPIAEEEAPAEEPAEETAVEAAPAEEPEAVESTEAK